MTKNLKRKSIGAKRNPHSAEAILLAAEEVLVEKGYSGFSIDAVASKARAGKPTIYKWWPNKATLLLDVYLRQKSIAFQNTGRLEEDLVALIDAILTNWRETSSGPIFRSLIAEAQMNAASSTALSDFASDRQTETSYLILQGLKRGEVSEAVEPIRAARWIVSYLWFRLLTGQLNTDAVDIRKDIEILLYGVAAKPKH